MVTESVIWPSEIHLNDVLLFWNCDFGEVVKGFAFPTDFLGDSSKSYWNLRNKVLVISNEPEGKMWKQVAVKWVHMCVPQRMDFEGK